MAARAAELEEENEGLKTMFRKQQEGTGDDRARMPDPPAGKSPMPMATTQKSMAMTSQSMGLKTPDERRKRFDETQKMIEAIE